MINFKPISFRLLCTLSIISNSLIAQISESKVIFQVGHSDVINHVQYNDKGTMIATSSEDKTINLIDARTGLIITTLKGHTKPVLGAQFFKSERLISCSKEEIIIWDLNKEIEVGRVNQSFNGPNTMCFSNNGEYAFVKDKNSFVNKLSISQNIKSSRAGEAHRFTDIEFLLPGLNENEVVIVGEGKVTTLDHQTNEKKNEIFLQDEPYDAFIENGLIYVANKYINWTAYDLKTGKFEKLIQGTSDNDGYYGKNKHILSHNLKNDVLAIKGYHREVKFYDLKSGTFNRKADGLLEIEGDYSEKDLDFTAFALSPNGKVLAAGMKIDKSSPKPDVYGLRFIDVKSGRLMKDDHGYYANIHKIRFSPNGKKLAIAGKGPLKILHAQNAGKPLTSCSEDTRRTKNLYWSPDSKVVAGSCTNFVGFSHYLVNLPTNESKELSHHFKYQYGIDMGLNFYMAPDFETVAGSNHLHNMETGEILAEYDVQKNYFRKETGKPSGNESKKVMIPNTDIMVIHKHLDNLYQTYSLYFMDTKEGKLLDVQTYSNENEFVVQEEDYNMSVSADGRWISVTAGTTDLIDVATKERKYQFRNLIRKEGSRRPIERRYAESTFSTDGEYLFTGGYDSLVYVIKTSTGQVVHKLSGHKDFVTSVSAKPNSNIVASSSADNRIFFWDYLKGEKLAELVVMDEEDFFILADDNYYYSSKKAIKKAGIKKGKRVLPIEQFDLKLNRPDIILKTLDLASESRIKVFEKAYQKRLAMAGITEDQLDDLYTGPKAEIVGKYDLPATTQNQTLTFHLKAMDENSNLKAYQVYINEVPIISNTGSAVLGKSLDKDIKVALSTGNNRIAVSVTNEKGVESIKEYFEVNLQKEYVPTLHILAIGVSEYNNKEYNLQYAAKDANDIIETFKNSSQFENIKEIKLTNKEATKTKIENALDDLKNTNIDDMVLIYFAGHGLLDKSFNYYLATHDINFENPQTGIDYNALEEKMGSFGSRNRLLLIDACHSGEVDKEYEISLENEPLAMGEVKTRGSGMRLQPKIGMFNSFAYMQVLFNNVNNKSGATIIAAAGGVEFAFESQEMKNGLFTHAIKSALQNNAADFNKDGVIRVSEVQGFVEAKVFELSQGKQVPTSRQVNNAIDFKLY